MIWFTRGALVALAALLWAMETPQAQPRPQNVSIQGDGIKLSGYLFVPTGLAKKVPGVVVLHGWGGSAEQLVAAGNSLAARGYVALTLSMRGFGQTGGADDCGLKQPDDTVLALKWLGARPEVDARRLGIVGFSQGGQVALLTAARTAVLKAVVAFFPVTDVSKWGETTSHFQIPSYVRGTCSFGGTIPRSPIAHAARVSGRVLLIHGDADTRVPTEQSILMQRALQKAGKPVELRLIPGAQHELTARDRSTSWPWVLAFLEGNL